MIRHLELRWKPGLAALLCACLLVWLGPAAAGGLIKTRMVCWKDEQGRRACGDSVPPQYLKKERKVLDESGRTREVIPAELTPEQIRQKIAADKEAEKLARAKEKQDAEDRALLETYTRPSEIAALRDDRLATLDTRTELLQKANARDANSLAMLIRRLPSRDSEKKPPKKLLKDIQSFERQVYNNERAMENLVRQRADICSDFSRDIRRFQELKSGEVSYFSPCPIPGSFSPQEETVVDLASARAFFRKFVELEREFNEDYLGYYHKDAVIRVRRVSEDGLAAEDELKLGKFREAVKKALPTDREKRATETYSAVQVVEETEGRAKIYAIRTSDRTKQSAPFEMVLAPRRGSKDSKWLIVEQSMQVSAR